MPEPHGFSWIEKPLLAAMAEPFDPEEFAWLRAQGIQLIVSLTETAPHRKLINDAGLMLVHEPVQDMTAPTQDQIQNLLSAIYSAHEHKMGVAIHCTAGLGRTGTVIACYFVDKGLGPREAIIKVRDMRPGSVETESQEEAVLDYARGRGVS